ncbi:LacI family DNA-binding transcriptional regulator [Psychrobacillus antarcticus]|uniref:LacI family DNA-binding transcriptional regulator n=1 Tax=Psychrobacillus antarcticus TaxID=2879115 RepID=UPI002407886D|nr:LacI family DNA-binding transcriptional regulator [Psychrobacillus antarcticus]
MAITIKDVAKLANVAPSTVSRVIANSPRISENTKKRVRDAMDELKYHPNFIARSLASQSTKVIGLVLPHSSGVFFQNPFFSEVIQGLSEGVHDNHYALQMTSGKTEFDSYEGVVQMVQGGRVDGIILLYSMIDDKIMEYLTKRKFPFVVIGKPYDHDLIDKITHVDNDNYMAAKEATEYIIGLGHNKIGFIGGSPSLTVTLDRLNGYKDALKSSNIELDEDYIIHGDFLREGGQEAVKALLRRTIPPTALLVTDDLMAVGVVNTLTEMHIDIPSEVSIISFNNALFAEMSRPPLTSIDINIKELGYQAASNLIQLLKIENDPVKRIIIPHRLVIRQSCGVAPKK